MFVLIDFLLINKRFYMQIFYAINYIFRDLRNLLVDNMYLLCYIILRGNIMNKQENKSNSDLNKYIGNNIKNIRKNNKLIQEELAQKLDISRQYLSGIETGKKGLSIKSIVDICNALNCTPNDIFNQRIDKIKNAKKSMYSYLTDENKLMINKLSKFLFAEQKKKP